MFRHKRRRRCAGGFWLSLQLTQKFEHGLLAFIRRSGEIDLGPPAHMLPQHGIQQRV
jgi:hypothetical protein